MNYFGELGQIFHGGGHFNFHKFKKIPPQPTFKPQPTFLNAGEEQSHTIQSPTSEQHNRRTSKLVIKITNVVTVTTKR